MQRIIELLHYIKHVLYFAYVFTFNLALSIRICSQIYIRRLTRIWHDENTPPTNESIYKILTSAFGCFGIALFFILLYIPQNNNNTQQAPDIVLLYYAGGSLFIGFILLFAVLLRKYFQAYFNSVKIIEGKYIVVYILIVTFISGLVRTAKIIENILLNDSIPNINIIRLLCIFSGIFIVIFFAAYIFTPTNLSRRSPDQYVQFLFQVAAASIFSTILFILLSYIWQERFLFPLWGYSILLIPSAWALISLIRTSIVTKSIIITTCVVVIGCILLLVIGEILTARPLWWLPMCLGFTTVAFMILGISRQLIECDRRNLRWLFTLTHPPD